MMYSSRPSSSRSRREPESSSGNGPLTAERAMMEQIRSKLERSQRRLAREQTQTSSQSSYKSGHTSQVGSSRYFPPDYKSGKAAPVKSMLLEDFSMLASSNGGHPPSTRRDPYEYKSSRAYDSRRHGEPSSSSHHRHHHQQQPSSQYRSRAHGLPPSSSSRHHHHQNAAPMSNSSFLVYATNKGSVPLSSASPSAYRGPSSSSSQSHHHAPPSTSSRVPPPPTSQAQPPVSNSILKHKSSFRRQTSPDLDDSMVPAPPSSRVRFEDLVGMEETGSYSPPRGPPKSVRPPPLLELDDEDDSDEFEKPKKEEKKLTPVMRTRKTTEKEKEKEKTRARPKPPLLHSPMATRKTATVMEPPKSDINVSAFDQFMMRPRRQTKEVREPPRSPIAASAMAPSNQEFDVVRAIEPTPTPMPPPAPTPTPAPTPMPEDLVLPPQKTLSSTTSSTFIGDSSMYDEIDDLNRVMDEKMELKEMEDTTEEEEEETPEEETAVADDQWSEEEPLDDSQEPVGLVEPPEEIGLVLLPYEPELDSVEESPEEDEADVSFEDKSPLTSDDDNNRPSVPGKYRSFEEVDARVFERSPVKAAQRATGNVPTIDETEAKAAEQQPQVQQQQLSDDDVENFRDDEVPKGVGQFMTRRSARYDPNDDYLAYSMTPTEVDMLADDDDAMIEYYSTDEDDNRSFVSSIRSLQVPHEREVAGTTRWSLLPSSSSVRDSPERTGDGTRHSSVSLSRPSENHVLIAEADPSRTPLGGSSGMRQPARPPYTRGASEQSVNAAPMTAGPRLSNAMYAPPPPSIRPASARPTVSRPSVTRSSVVRAPMSTAPMSTRMPMSSRAPISSRAPPPTSTTAFPTSSRRLRPKNPMQLRKALPPSIGALSGLASGPVTFDLNESAFYAIVWQTGEFGFSFQRVYLAVDGDDSSSRLMFLRMLLNTERATCASFRNVHVGDVLIQIGDTRVCDLPLANAGASALTKYFTELRSQTPLRLVFQRTDPSSWEGGVEL